MHDPRSAVLRGIRWAAVALATLVMVAAAAPARAAGDEDFKGWFLTLDAALTQPTGLEQQYAYKIDPTVTGVALDRLVMDNDADFTGMIKFGYGFGNGLGRLQVSFWGFDNEDQMSSTETGGVVPTVFGYGYSGMYLYDYGYDIDVQAKSKVQAATFDIDYLRSYAVGKKTTVTWLAGLRSAAYEETVDFVGTELYYGDVYQQHKHFDADALGLKLGAAVKFGFTDHFALDGSTTFSFLQGSSEGDSYQVFPNGWTETLKGKDDNVRGEMREFDLKANWSYGMMDYFVGYRMETWDGLVIDPVIATGFSSSTQGRDNVSFNSLHAGVTFKFGGK
jgi:hypothetical protein